MVVVITGATKGIGRAIVDILASEGCDLALCARTQEDLRQLQEQLAGLPNSGRVFVRQVDVRNRAVLTHFAEEVLKFFGQVDVLINNAGNFKPGRIQDEPEGVFDLVMQTNLESAYFLTRALLPAMIRRQSGHIINMCSVASVRDFANGGSYAISKHALHGFGKTLREEVREYGIRVTNILPGATWTDSWAGADFPEDRLMDAASVAQMVLAAIRLAPNAVMEELIIRPVGGDL